MARNESGEEKYISWAISETKLFVDAVLEQLRIVGREKD